ncbi:phosphatidylinositol 3,4,5-trisphosphate 3-phosphatase and dual-specificity protein phosphatase PTEN-like isoform X2 [Mercenaria mercenaria]|uniref:phosphatidylinositol 3,4,5-trisphosphate 3-phosphatase and dual-specificity protein phosphatase PTEN-like isoform X2 n=1 Tax=Mercenaria mercenaria TaxID=6596 RepID=UPI00234FB32A|nr:phosphatidylinositol 3,4,5-trisphosphate 3-phosphatase and dual-specificity protein phosphatase PTEN-like isoform X2 [Mercenaria mercenaria]
MLAGYYGYWYEYSYRNTFRTECRCLLRNRFLDSKHKDHYRVYNLCSERKYDGTKFHNRVVMYPFEDHHPPPLELIKPFCEELDTWLHTDQKNIAAIHCKAGKGRTGVMICAYLLHRRRFIDAKTCLDYYGKTRTRDGKGVTIPSQRRYVEYYGELMKHNVSYERKTLLFTKVKFITVPHLNNGTCNVFYDIFANKVKLGSSALFEGQQSKMGTTLEMPLSKSVIVCGDCCVDFFHKPPRIGKKERIFQCWFNTFFIKDEEYCEDENGKKKRYLTLTMTKTELDKANKDKTNKIYKKDFKVVFYFEYPIDGTYINNPNGVNRSRTEDSLFTRPIARNGNTSNGSIRGIGAKPSVTRGSPVEPMSRLHVSESEPECDSNTVPGRKAPPTTSQSYPELGKLENTSTLVNAQKHLQVINKHTKPQKLSPTGDRRGRYLPDTNSDNDMASTGESEQEDNFSDSDTDDEWDGCEVTAV